MIKSKIVDYLEKFSAEEFKEFGRYVNSPYFNVNKKLITSYNYFKIYYGDFSNKHFNKEGLYSAVFPGTKYRDTETRKLLSGLTKLAEGYMCQNEYDKNDFEKNINLAGKLLSKDLVGNAEKIVAQLEEISAKEKINGQHYFYELMKIQIKKKSIELKKESFQTGNLTEDKINSYLLNYFVSFSTKIVQNIKAKQYYNLIADEPLLPKFFSFIDLDRYIEWLEETKFEFSEILIMNLCIIKCVNDAYDKQTYSKFKELLLNNHKKISHFELNNLFTCLQGIQIKRIRENDAEALKELFEVNNLILEHEAYAFYPGGSMPYSVYVTMITIGISSKEFEWVSSFIKKFTPMLQEKHRGNLYNYAMAELTYSTGSTSEALEYTSKIEYEGFFLKHEVNILKLKIYYDEDDFISVLYQLDSYKKLVEGNKFVGEQQYDIYSGFIKVFSELVKVKENKDKASAEILLSKTEKLTNVQNKDWLLEKIKELI